MRQTRLALPQRSPITDSPHSPLSFPSKKLIKGIFPGLAASVARMLFAVWTLFSAGCAVPGEPLPPLLEIPQPVSDLAAEQLGATLHISFTVPQLTTEGTRARRLDRLELFAYFLPASSPDPDFPAQAERIASWPAGDLTDRQTQITHTVELEAPRIGQRVWLGVKAINHRHIDAGFSNLVALEVADLPEAPANLTATLTEQAVLLTWSPSPRSVFGGPAPASEPAQESYEIFRALLGSELPAQRIGTSSAPSFADRDFVFGQRYRYTLRAIARRGDVLAASVFSPAAEVAATDRFPPAAPRNLRAIAVTGAVELAWSPGAEADLAGYNVYRAQTEPDAAARVRLHAAPVDIPLFRDMAVRSSASYFYTVTAVDREGNESAPSNEESVETE